MLRCWVAVFAVLSALDARAEAAELEGFGPIKFGMSKDEAWAAIGGKGEWIKSDILRYSYSYGRGKKASHFEVSQEFKQGRASQAEIEYFTAGLTPESCSWDGIRFADLIRHKYGVAPTVSYGVPYMATPGNSKSYVMVDEFEFSFGEQGSIKITSILNYAATICRITMNYHITKYQ